MSDIVISAPLLAILVPLLGYLMKRLLDSYTDRIKSEREDKLSYRNALFESMSLASRAATSAEKATSAAEKAIGS
jgi:hypothetical protein